MSTLQTGYDLWNSGLNLPGGLRDAMVQMGVQTHNFNYPVTLTAVSHNQEVAVFQWANKQATEKCVCAVFQSDLVFPIHLYLTNGDDPNQKVLYAEKEKGAVGLSKYRLLP